MGVEKKMSRIWISTLLLLWVLVLPVQADQQENASSALSSSPLLSELTVEEFSEVVKTIVQQTLEECSVEGGMQGKAKLNLDVKGDVTAKIVCEKNTDTEAE